ncbi:MAG TPA: hypothetical protein VGD62_01805 [Acidobacteriaceae bacterium]
MTQDDLELEQYRSLRAEILRAMEDGNQVMSFGLAAIGIVLTAGMNAKGTALSFFMFALVVPALSSLVLSMWFAAQERIARASYFITGIEARLAQSLSFKAPLWDSWLRTSSKRDDGPSHHHFWNTEFSGIAIFAFLIFGPLFFSSLVSGTSLPLRVRVAVVLVAGVAYILFFFWIRRRVERWQAWLSKVFGELE